MRLDARDRVNLPRRVAPADHVHLVVESPPADAHTRARARQRIEPRPGPFWMPRTKARCNLHDGRLHDSRVSRRAELQVPVAARAITRVAVRWLRHLDGHFDEVCLDHDRGAFVRRQPLRFADRPQAAKSVGSRSWRRQGPQRLQGQLSVDGSGIGAVLPDVQRTIGPRTPRSAAQKARRFRRRLGKIADERVLAFEREQISIGSSVARMHARRAERQHEHDRPPRSRLRRPQQKVLRHRLCRRED